MNWRVHRTRVSSEPNLPRSGARSSGRVAFRPGAFT
ncbi:hypothetical protein DUNSADRAFT_16547 [Dunaliella salina]|uniref:Encoded protein n=1 Tax=Dunaliella salina TaxID=3046 RepID=A0ABQ7G3B8_DUNSA|nr:hypothetical protein DUNSADRAFT_16547 [Dunaliella salina]|eukprot:KAF5829095.1 hypothetical protein DUNSADRAFT_16547 [Dunaliella salina]